MLFDRQKRLLALVNALGDEVGGLDYQKLLFLFCHEMEEEPAYEFVPYKFGGFSFTSYADKRRMIEKGLLADEDRSWKLTPAGEMVVVKESLHNQMGQFAKRYRSLRGDALVAETYRRYPYYAIRSEIADRVLAGDEGALKAIIAARPATTQPGLVTIGYEGKSLEGYLNKLIRNGVTILCDVRRNPLSRKYGFSKGALSKSCDGVGIRYEHLPELGIASEERRELKTQADYDELFEIYKRNYLPKQDVALNKIKSWIDKGERVAITCYERLPEQCHRHCVADELVNRFGKAFKPQHL
jgi:hypothetical protein